MVKENVMKQTEIGLIPEDWDVVFISDVSNVIGGGTPKTNVKEFWNKDVNWFTPSEIGNVKYISKSIRKISQLGLLNSSAKLLPVGTILLTSRATIGDCAILKQGGATNQGFQSLVVNKNNNNEFVYYLVETLKSKLIQNASGSTFLEISPNKVKSIQIPRPPIAEQEVIAKALSDCDMWIESLERVVAKKRLIKQAAMQKLLTPKEDWEVRKLGDLTKIFTKQTGFDYTAFIKPSLLKVKSDDTIPFIQNKDFNNKWINLNTDYFIPKSIAFKFPRILLDEKSLLISISGSVGNIGVYDLDDIAFIGGAVAILKFKNPLLIDWVLFYLKSDDGQIKLLKNVKSGSHKNLILDDIRKVDIVFPKYEEQTRIATILSDMDEEIEALEQKLKKARQIKQGMMQELLTGRVRLV